MDPVFLYTNASHHVCTLAMLTPGCTTAEQLECEELRSEIVKLAQCLPYLRRALACNLCDSVLNDPIFVLECFHWCCLQCPQHSSSSAPSSAATRAADAIASAASISQAMADTAVDMSAMRPNAETSTKASSSGNDNPASSCSSGSSITETATVDNTNSTRTGTSKTETQPSTGVLTPGSAAKIASRRRSSRAGDLACYTRRCKYCLAKSNTQRVSMMSLLCTAYHQLCSSLHARRHLYTNKPATGSSTPVAMATTGAAAAVTAGMDRKTRSKDGRGDFSFLGKLVDESRGVPGVHVGFDDLPSGNPPDDMFTGEYLRLKASTTGPDDRRLLDITSLMSMYRNTAPVSWLSTATTTTTVAATSSMVASSTTMTASNMPASQNSCVPEDSGREENVKPTHHHMAKLILHEDGVDSSPMETEPVAPAIGKRKRGRPSLKARSVSLGADCAASPVHVNTDANIDTAAAATVCASTSAPPLAHVVSIDGTADARAGCTSDQQPVAGEKKKVKREVASGKLTTPKQQAAPSSPRTLRSGRRASGE
eukprot:scpid55232/ scgid11529/ 